MKPALVDVAVLILFFNRPEPLKAVFSQVKKARPSKLFLYQDGPRNEKDMPGILACREVVKDIDWECEVQQLYQEKNYGCDPSEYMSQKWAFSHVDKCIVLEDDDIPSLSFFPFCKELLDKYAQLTFDLFPTQVGVAPPPKSTHSKLKIIARPKSLAIIIFYLVAGAGFEPTTFGL